MVWKKEFLEKSRTWNNKAEKKGRNIFDDLKNTDMVKYKMERFGGRTTQQTSRGPFPFHEDWKRSETAACKVTVCEGKVVGMERRRRVIMIMANVHQKYVISVPLFLSVSFNLPVFSFFASLLSATVASRRRYVARTVNNSSLIGTVAISFFLFFNTFLKVVGRFNLSFK